MMKPSEVAQLLEHYASKGFVGNLTGTEWKTVQALMHASHDIGVSSERERLTKFVADWRRIAKASDVIYGELNREAEALRECAEEIETAFALAAPSSAVPETKP